MQKMKEEEEEKEKRRKRGEEEEEGEEGGEGKGEEEVEKDFRASSSVKCLLSCLSIRFYMWTYADGKVTSIYWRIK